MKYKDNRTGASMLLSAISVVVVISLISIFLFNTHNNDVANSVGGGLSIFAIGGWFWFSKIWYNILTWLNNMYGRCNWCKNSRDSKNLICYHCHHNNDDYWNEN